jgi:hypothetical protein
MDHSQVKPTACAHQGNDNGRPEDRLVSVTLGLHRILRGLSAPVALLTTVLPPVAPAATVKSWPSESDFGSRKAQAGDSEPC